MSEDPAARTVMLKYNFNEVNTPHPRDWFQVIAPTAISRHWVPQMMVDEVWLYYQFATSDEMERFKARLESPYKELVAERPIMKWIER